MTEWSKHVHRFAKKNKMTYKQANVSKKCKETYKKRKTSPRRRRMNNPPDELSLYKTWYGKKSHQEGDPSHLENEKESLLELAEEHQEDIDEYKRIIDLPYEEGTGDKSFARASIVRSTVTLNEYKEAIADIEHDMTLYKYHFN